MKKKILDIYFIDIFRLLIRKWKTIGLVTLAAAILGVFIAIGSPAEYISTVKMAPEGLRNSSGGISDLAAMAGVEVSMTSRSDAISPMVYPDVVASTPFLVKLIKVKVPVKTQQKSLYAYMNEELKAPFISKVFAFPFKLVDVIRSVFMSSDKVSKIDSIESIDAYQLTKIQEKTLASVRKRISIDVDKKKRIIIANVRMQDPKVCAVVADSLVTFLNGFITGYRTEKAKLDYEFTSSLLKEAKRDYYSAQARYAQYSDENNNLVKNSITIEKDRLFNEQQLAFAVYSNLAQQLETAKIRVQEQTPCISMIEPARVPVFKSNMSKMTMVGFFILLGFFASMFGVLIFNHKLLFRKSTQSE